MGLAVKNLRVYRESQRAPEFAFLRRALSVLMPVPALVLLPVLLTVAFPPPTVSVYHESRRYPWVEVRAEPLEKRG